jgi:hypothetical protein
VIPFDVATSASALSNPYNEEPGSQLPCKLEHAIVRDTTSSCKDGSLLKHELYTAFHVETVLSLSDNSDTGK